MLSRNVLSPMLMACACALAACQKVAPDVSALTSQISQAPTAGPVLTFTLAQSSPSASSSVTVSGTCFDADGIPVNGIHVCAKLGLACGPGDYTHDVSCVAGSYTASLTLTDGSYDLQVMGEDTLGQPSSSVGLGSPSFIVDTTAPVAPLLTQTVPATSGVPGSVALQMDVSGSESGGQVRLYKGTSCTASPYVTLPGAATPFDVTIPVSELTQGLNEFVAKSSDAAGNFSPCSSALSYTFDSVAPTVIGVNSMKADGTYAFGTIINIQVTFSEAVTFATPPSIALNSGGTAAYDSGSGSNTITFRYVVGANQNTADLDLTGAPPTGDLQDAAGNPVDFTGAAGALAAAKNLAIDTTAPVLMSITLGSAGVFTDGNLITLSLNFSEPVSWLSNPELLLNSGGTAVYSSGNGTTSIVLNYLVNTGDFTPNGQWLDKRSDTALSGGFTDTAMNMADMDLAGKNIQTGATVNGLKLVAVYPSYSKWATYVAYDNDNGGTDPYDQDQVTCTNAETPRGPDWTGCIHGGEKRRLTLKSYTSCTNLEASDSLGAFDWTCKVSGGFATFYSVGLKPGKGLRDLLDATVDPVVWKNVSLDVSEAGVTVATSQASPWADNLLYELTAQSSNATTLLSSQYAVFYAKTPTPIYMLQVNAPSVSIVTLAGAALQYNDQSATYNCNSTTGTPSTPDTKSIVCSAMNFGWIEADLNGGSSPTNRAISAVVLAYAAKQTRIHNSQFSGFGTAGTPGNAIVLRGTKRTRISDVKIMDAGGALALSPYSTNNPNGNVVTNLSASFTKPTDGSGTLDLSYGDENRFYNIRLLNLLDHGGVAHAIRLSHSDGNIFNQLEIMNVGTTATDSYGVVIPTSDDSDGNIFSRVAIGGVAGAGFLFESPTASGNLISHYSAARTGSYGAIALTDGASNLFANSVLASSDTVRDGVVLTTTSGGNHRINNIAVTDVNNAISDLTTDSLDITGYLNTNRPCNFVDGLPCSSRYPGGNYVTGGFFNGFSGGNVNWYVLMAWDWLNASPLMSWMNASTLGACGPGNDCQAWDFHPSNTSSIYLHSAAGTYVANNSVPTGGDCGSGGNATDPFVVMDSTKLLTVGARTFLAHAVEIPFDGVGNDDGLCEYGEDCMYAPHLGAHQGSGPVDPNAACTIMASFTARIFQYPNP